MQSTYLIALGTLCVAAAFLASRSAAAAEPAQASVLGFTVKDIDGQDVQLSKFAGKVLLIVNVASLCGNTPQYKPLEALYEKYKDRGFEILAFPANNFLFQEPGSDAQIREFCTSHYNVTFPLFSKISVKGSGIHPLYKFLTSKATDPEFGGDIEWNFAKFLIGRDGKIAGRVKAGRSPDSPEVVAQIEELLSAPAPH
ncbi:MAG: glutathione peroxidase [Capsulimonadaceae bacterium]|nr:glutathione peroxidase [Capsulimonadaceae bacterium]